MAIFSQSRADLYESALDRPRNETADLNNMPQHLLKMLYERTNQKMEIKNGDVVDHFAPTFDEARMLAALQAHTLKVTLDMIDDGFKKIAKRSIPPEVLDFMFDQLPGGQHYDALNVWDVVTALRPTKNDQRAETKAVL